MTELCGVGHQLCALLPIARSGAALKAEDRQREHCAWVSARGRQFVPLGRFLIVLRNAKPVCIEFTEQRHRLRIFPIEGALRRELRRP